MNEDFREFVVSSDPNIAAELRAKFEELGSDGLADYALSLGLHPPGYEAGQRHSIAEYAPPGHDGPGYLVWSIGLWSPDAEDQDGEDDEEDDDEAPDPWAALE
ncbi:hypothetical protein AB0K52_00370 [Glycomyces sp. NPDC049804]|uniref:hypothetical protein n=1 Tax=Glycomyces sp. NPDC049804 TaxID=3154363 RepID=UPI0034301F39